MQFTPSDPGSTRDNVDLSSRLSVMTEPSPSDSENTDAPTQNDAADQSSVADQGNVADSAAENTNHMGGPLRAIRPHGIEGARKLAAAAARVALDNNGSDVVVLDVCKQSAEFDLFVLATGTSRRQLHAISDQIDDALQKDLGDRRLGVEGFEESRWIVLDYGSVVIHLFDDETREFYDLESLWADGVQIPLSELGVEVDA